MAHIVTLNTPSREDWLTQLADVVTDPDELLRLLNIDADEKLLAGRSAKKLFALRVPRSFIDRMEKGNPNDAHPELDEIIFSGGDPLMAKDHELDWLLTQLEAIPHIKRLRIHSRLPIVIPARITDALVERFSHSTLQILLVNHINHANEIDETFRQAMAKLRRVGVTLLNQSVLLRGVNDNAQTLANLSNALFDAGVMPYYLHVLDKVQGAAHFMVSDDEARQIMRELLTLVSGYLVPKLAREIGGEPSKTPLDLQLRQQ